MRRTQQRKSNKEIDPLRIRVSYPNDLAYWSEVLGVTKERLEAAVKVAGAMVVNVRKLLAK